MKRYYDLAFGTRPAEELYDLKKDPAQVNNVAGNKEYRSIKKDLAIRLFENLDATGDPRVQGRGKFFDLQPYLGQGPIYPNQ